MPLEISLSPDVNKAAEFLENAFKSRKLVLIIGDCKVDYDGRASSTLDWGERILLIKKDGSILVHRPTGYEPVNWQPPKCSVTISRPSANSLIIHATRLHPRETVSVEYRSISLAAVGSLHDQGEFALHVTEAQMKQAILTAPDLVEEGLIPLEEEKHVSDVGFTDIYAQDKKGSLVIVEIKRNAADKEAVTQLQGYLNNIRKRVNRPIRGIIAAPELRRSAQPLLDSLKLEFVKVDPERCFSVLKTQKDMKLSQFIS